MRCALPPWCRSVSGDGPTLVVAPHGGTCTRDLLAAATAGALRGNDLYTEEVALRLAERLGGSLIANPEIDRNELDLNRISEVAEGAPWFLDLLRCELERILARHPVAQLLIVHGWHVIQPRCDVGIGARLAHGALAAQSAARLTVSPAYVRDVLERLREAGEELGIRTTYGERWPAAHRNNVMQIFRRERLTPASPHPLAALAAGGRIEAVQIELGVPLRWPGPWRERFLRSAAAAFGEPPRSVATRGVASGTVASARAEGRAAAPRGFSLQAYDLAAGGDGLGIVVGLGAMSPDELGARLLLLPGGQRMLLYTGHERIGRGAAGTVGGLEVRPCAGGFVVRFRGPVLDVADASRYFRHEPAQREAAIVELELDVRFLAVGDGSYGCVEGVARFGERTWGIGAHGFTEPVLARMAPAASGTVRLTASFGAELGVAATLAPGPGNSIVRCLTASGWSTHTAETDAALPAIRAGRLPEPFAIQTGDGPRVLCTPRSHVTILRPAGEGAHARITFGAATFELADGRVGGGFYEHGEGV